MLRSWLLKQCMMWHCYEGVGDRCALDCGVEKKTQEKARDLWGPQGGGKERETGRNLIITVPLSVHLSWREKKTLHRLYRLLESLLILQCLLLQWSDRSWFWAAAQLLANIYHQREREMGGGVWRGERCYETQEGSRHQMSETWASPSVFI